MAPTTKPVFIQSPFLGVPHAFTTRQGGVSQGFFASLNFGNPSDLPEPDRDPTSNIAENLRRTLEAIDPALTMHRLVQTHQVHGAAVHIVRRGDAAAPAGSPSPRADAIITDDPSCIVAIRTADCAPLLLATADSRAVAAIHAGWRGVVANVVRATVHAMRECFPAAARSGPMSAVIGPCIGPDNFEVGPEVAAEFDRIFPDTSPVRNDRVKAPLRAIASRDHAHQPRAHIDLPAALRMQLRACGVENAGRVGGCTFSQPDLFYSHRRDKGLTGRMIALIAPSQS